MSKKTTLLTYLPEGVIENLRRNENYTSIFETWDEFGEVEEADDVISALLQVAIIRGDTETFGHLMAYDVWNVHDNLFNHAPSQKYAEYHCAPIFVAIINEKNDFLRTFTESGADINIRDEVDGPTKKRQYTPLHCAVERGNLQAVEILRFYGADLVVKTKDRYKETPYELAERIKSKGSVFKEIYEIWNNINSNIKPEVDYELEKDTPSVSTVKEWFGLDGVNDSLELSSWRARGRSPIQKDHLNELGELLQKIDVKINVDRNLKEPLKNIIAYTCKLMSEDNRDGKTQRKIDAATAFLRTVLESEEINPDEIHTAARTALQADENRGMGFYKVHSFFKNKRYWDEDPHKGLGHLVKSTLGELIYDFDRAVARDSEPNASEDMGKPGRELK